MATRLPNQEWHPAYYGGTVREKVLRRCLFKCCVWCGNRMHRVRVERKIYLYAYDDQEYVRIVETHMYNWCLICGHREMTSGLLDHAG